ncbi:hypothetical protein BH09CHL1_BH09CHL1_10240 [soil metagenome]
MNTDVFDNAEKSQVTRRRVISGIAGVGAAVIAGTTLARAQESTPEAGTTDDTDTTDTTTPDDMRGSNYQTFLTKLAAELSLTDTTALDTDIRDALKAMVDDELAAGDLAANDATDMKTAIDESTSPIKVSFFSHDGFGGGMDGGPGGMGGGMNSRGTRSNGKPGDDSEGTDDADTTATPAA